MTDLPVALAQGPVIGDGAMGTLLAAGDPEGMDGPLEAIARSRPDRVEAAHVAYLNAGSQLIQTATFRSNRVRLSRLGLAASTREIQLAAARAARRAVEASGHAAWILGDLGPTGLTGPALDDGARVAATFQEQAEALADGGVDGFIVETLSDPREWLSAVRGTRAAADRTLVTTVSLSAEGFSRDGFTLEDFVQALLAHWDERPDAFGLGCSAGPAPLLSHLRRLRALLAAAGRSLPLVVQPNAGMPTRRSGTVVFGATPEYFGRSALAWAAAGASLLGACCGTTAEHIAAIRGALDLVVGMPQRADGEEAPRADAAAPWAEPAWAEAAPPEPAAAPPEPAFWISLEVDPPKGPRAERMLEHARQAAQAGAHAVNVGDSPMARVRMSSLASAALIEREAGIDALLHFTTRDRNLMGIQADLLGAHALGLRSILALTGDPPGLGDYAHATAVYDIDAIGLIRLITEMNGGADARGRPLSGQTAFHVSAGVDPGAPDLDQAVRRTREKLDAGAARLLTQPVYAPEVLDRLLDALRPEVPVVLGVMPLLTGRQADYLHHEVPGIRIPEPVREAMHRAGEHGERVGLELARELVARLRDRIQGVYVVPSLGRMKGPLSLIREWHGAWDALPARTRSQEG